MTALLWLLRLGLGALLVASGALKLGDPAAFAAEIANYHLLPALSPLLAVTLPPVEIVLGLALIAGPRPWLRAAALAATLVLAVFTVAVASVVARGIDVDCGCFGSASSSPVTMLTVLRDIALVAAAVAIYGLATRGQRGGASVTPAAPARG